MLKNLIILQKINAGESSPTASGHGILKLWNEYKKLGNTSGICGDTLLVSQCGSIIGDFDSLDPLDQTFRYTSDRGNSRFLSNESLLNLADFNVVAASLAEVLEDEYDKLMG